MITNSTGQLSAEAGIAPAAPSLHRRRRGALWRSRFSYVAFAASFLVLLIVANAIVNPVAFSAGQILTTIGLAAPLVFAAMAVTPAVLVGGGGIDLSVGPLMSLVGAFIIVGVIQDLGITTAPVVIAVALATGIASGLLTGALVAVLRLQPIVATLGTYLAYGGVTLIIAPQPTGSVPQWLADMAQGGSLPTLGIVFVAWWLFTRTPLYEALMATGGDDRAAFVAGIPVTRVRIMAYVLSGVLASIAGLSLAALLGSVDPNAGAQYTLIGIASVALGGVSLAGGRGGMVGAVVGALDIFLIDNVLTYYNISSFLEQVVYGAILVAAVCINRIVAARIGGPEVTRVPAAEPDVARYGAFISQLGRYVPQLTALGSLLALFVVGAFVIQGFASVSSIDAVLILSAFLGIGSIGQTGAILLGGIDLSIPFVMDTSNVLSAQLSQDGWPFLAAGLVAVAVGAGIGAFNGYLSSRLRVHPLIVTLGIGYLAQGAVEMWTDGNPSGVAPNWLGSVAAEGTRIAGAQIAPIVVIWAAIVVLVLIALRSTAFGRRLRATGSNPRAAELALVSRVRIWTLTFMLSGIFASIAGILLLGFGGSASAIVGDPYLFLTVGAVVVGGTSLAGGRGGYGGTVLGAVMLTVLSTILVGVGYSASVQQLLVGVIILVVVASFGREAHVRDRV